MKTKNIITASFALLLAVIFTSCSTSIDIAKRQHSNGYYIHVSSKKAVNTPAAEVVSAKKEVQTVAVKEVKNEPVVVAMQSAAPVVKEEASSDVKAVSVSSKKSKVTAAPSEVVSSEENNVEAPQAGVVQKKMNRKASRMLMRGDAPAIVLILLCIFLPFVAVGIVDDWHTKFWFSVLLTLCFWFPGVIYAFFVCFA